MAYWYNAGDRDQLFLLPPSMYEWLEEGHLAYFVIDAIKLMDTSAFDAAHPRGPGRPAYDPRMLLGLLLYGYSTGIRSSRLIERACRENLAFKVIAVNLVPDHGTIARFRAENEAAIKSVFFEVLALCHQAGLASLGQIAIDGTKVGSDAALDQNRSEAWIRAEIERVLSEASEADDKEQAEERLFEDVSLPEPFRHATTRLDRLRAALVEVQAATAVLAEKEATAKKKADDEATAGRKLPGRKPKDPSAALVRAEADLRASQVRLSSSPESVKLLDELASAARAVVIARTAAETAPKAPGPVANITDPESRIMNTKDGWVQGFNVQASVNAEQVVLAYATTQDHNDVNQLVPMIDATEKSATTAGITEEIGQALADAGYWSEDNATAEGPDRLIATTKDWKQRKLARELGETTGPPPKDASPLEAMEHRLRTKEGAKAYGARSYTVEPVFGETKENRGFRRFMRRGLVACDSEAGLIFAAHNLMKIFRHNPSAVFGTT